MWFREAKVEDRLEVVESVYIVFRFFGHSLGPTLAYIYGERERDHSQQGWESTSFKIGKLGAPCIEQVSNSRHP